MTVENLTDCVTHSGSVSTDCDAMKIAEYGKLVASATKQLQIKVTSANDKSI